jgi:hypothetical protein
VDAGGVLLGVTVLAFIAAVALVTVTGWRLYGPLAGVTAGILLATRPSLLRETGYGSTDLWFIALLGGAALLATRVPQRAAPTLGVLAVAGLIRPEAWALSAAYVLWRYWRRPWRACVAAVALAVAAPVAWAFTDLIITGDALHSLHGTSALAAQLDRPRSVATAVTSLPRYLRALLGDIPTVLGLMGALLSVWWLYDRSLVILGCGALGMVMFLILGLLGLPLLDRYLLVPAVSLTLLAGAAVGGWMVLGRGSVRRGWMAGAIAMTVAVAVGLAADMATTANSDAQLSQRHGAQQELMERLLGGDIARAARRGGVQIPDYRALPLVARQLGLDPQEVLIAASGGTRPAVVIAYASPQAQQAFGVGANSVWAPPQLDGYRTVSRGRWWRIAVRDAPPR